ncbi:MAG TPA: hypothetical protein VML50_04135 [Anaeromyxobacter sp.]|nr:hypothetical protein [Anaeromyxobacter sp.]
MKRTLLLATLSAFVLGACATSGGGEHYSVVPKVTVVTKGEKRRTAEANYQARPEDAPLTGSGGADR